MRSVQLLASALLISAASASRTRDTTVSSSSSLRGTNSSGGRRIRGARGRNTRSISISISDHERFLKRETKNDELRPKKGFNDNIAEASTGTGEVPKKTTQKELRDRNTPKKNTNKKVLPSNVAEASTDSGATSNKENQKKLRDRNAPKKNTNKKTLPTSPPVPATVPEKETKSLIDEAVVATLPVATGTPTTSPTVKPPTLFPTWTFTVAPAAPTPAPPPACEYCNGCFDETASVTFSNLGTTATCIRIRENMAKLNPAQCDGRRAVIEEACCCNSDAAPGEEITGRVENSDSGVLDYDTACSFCAGKEYIGQNYITFVTEPDQVSCAGFNSLIETGFFDPNFCIIEKAAVEQHCCGADIVDSGISLPAPADPSSVTIIVAGDDNETEVAVDEEEIFYFIRDNEIYAVNQDGELVQVTQTEDIADAVEEATTVMVPASQPPAPSTIKGGGKRETGTIGSPDRNHNRINSGPSGQGSGFDSRLAEVDETSIQPASTTTISTASSREVDRQYDPNQSRQKHKSIHNETPMFSRDQVASF